ncbi:MAG: zinc-binding dehydrogenase [Verrucomicrobia bacterium]|nr:zinc-binding dehydrogenase [Verrucomicrobiota bacterium]
MKALVLNAAKQPLEMEERAELTPDSGDVVVKLKTAALNRRDFWITRGMYPGIVYPIILGSDGAGVVSQVGEGVESSWIGNEVIINPSLDWGNKQIAQADDFNILGLPRDGTFATEVTVPESQLHAKPAHLNWEEAAALPLAGLTAYRALFSQGGLQQGETILITGVGGGVATFVLQFAVAAGAEVWVTSSSEQKIDRAVKLGAKRGFLYTAENWAEDFVKTAGAPSLIIDSAAGPAYDTLIDLVAMGGRIVNFGATLGPPDKLEMRKLFWKQLRLQGSTMGSPADFEDMLKFSAKHGVVPIIDATYSLAEGNTAIEQMKVSPQFGKYVLTND